MRTTAKTLVAALMTLLLSIPRGIAHGDSWGPIKETEVFSADRNYMLKVSPHQRRRRDMREECQATLYSLNGDSKTEIWTRYLINTRAPVRAFVSDTGKYVVTMDEWHGVGELPVVIYGARGRLVKAHSIKSLGLEGDIGHIRTTMGSHWWNEDSVSFFGLKEETFFIRLHWGKMLILDLSTGNLVAKGSHGFGRAVVNDEVWRTLLDFAAKHLRQRALAMLLSMEPDDRKIGATLSGEMLIREAIPRLRQLLKDRSYYTIMGGSYTESTLVLYVRKAASEALKKLGEEPGPVLTELPEKGHLKYDERKAMYVVVFDDEEDEAEKKRGRLIRSRN